MSLKNRQVIVLSVDAMVYEDIETLSRLSTFQEVWHRVARVNKVKSIYPSITYPCHVTMETGMYPDKHGIINNEQPIIGQRNSPWQHERSLVKTKTIFDYAKEAGLTTASVFWPVTGNDPAIDYLINEYWPQTPEETAVECFRNSGSSEEVIEKVVKPNLPILDNHHRKHPYCDIFIMRCACEMVRNFKPNLLLIHPANVDAYRHQTGLFTEKVTQGLYETGTWFFELMKACEDAGILDDTDFFVVSDHGQMNISRCVAPNVKLKEAGLIDVDEAGEVKDWRAFCKAAGLSAHVYLKNPDNKKDWEATRKVLDDLCAEGVYGISRVYTAQEAQKEEHLAGDFSFVLETDDFTSFANDWNRPLTRRLDNQNYRFGRATHGHLPHKGPQPTLFAFGPHIKEGVVMENAHLVDEAPTFAGALGIEMPGTDGRCLKEILK